MPEITESEMFENIKTSFEESTETQFVNDYNRIFSTNFKVRDVEWDVRDA